MLKSLHPTPGAVPARLSAETVKLAGRYLDGDFKDTVVPAAFGLTPEEESSLSVNMQYARSIRLIAEQAPLRILPEEKLVGAATLQEAINHHTPASKFAGTSHITIGFNAVLKTGYTGLRRQLEQRQTDPALTAEQQEFLQTMTLCLDAAGIWHNRIAAELERRIADSTEALQQHYRIVYRGMRAVPENPPQTFHEAVQSLWLMFAFQRLCGNWSGLGRMDEMLGPYLENDLKKGVITLDEARELLAHFWIKGTEWRLVQARYGGDAQNYQNVILGGIDRHGRDVTNTVTYLILDVVEELHISDYPVAVRIGPDTPEKLLRRIAEVQRLGGGIVAVYNEPMVIRALTRFGFPEADAREFTNDGCWEAIIGGRSAFTYLPFDAMMPLQDTLALDRDMTPEFASYDALYRDYLDRLATVCRQNDEVASHTFKNTQRHPGNGIEPTPLLSLFVEGCIANAVSYNDRGALYTISAIHAGGLPDVANSLYVIRKLVYEEQRLTLAGLTALLRRNWEGAEDLRLEILRDYPLYGNDDADADDILARVVADYAAIAGATYSIDGVLRPVGISTFGREIGYAKDRKATAFGRKAGEILATNLAPTPGSDRNGPTAVIKSFCKVDFTAIPNGCPLELKLHPSCCRGDAGLDAMVGLLRAFVALGGYYLQVDVVDSALLRQAQEHPEQFPNLCVRISGWSARFDTLDRDWQEMIIQRTQQRF